MPRPTATLDAFAAIAAPRRRQILQLLGERKLPVTQLIDELRWPQPTVSKHLAVLRQAGLVRVQRRSRQKIYEMQPRQLRSIHDWTSQFERLWDGHLQRVKSRAQTRAAQSTQSS